MDLKNAYKNQGKLNFGEKNSKQIKIDIESIREWIVKQEYMNSKLDDEFILRFLTTAKFSYVRTQELIRNYWINRTKMIEFFHDRNYDDDSLMMEIADLGFFIKLPYVDNEGRVLVLQRIGVWDSQKYEFKDIAKYIFTCLDAICEDSRAQENGVVMIFDMTQMSTSHATNVTPARVKNLFACFQDTYPLKLKLINYYNNPKIFDTVFAVFKMFLKEKIKDRIKFHGSDLKLLHKEIPKSFLPKEYGGDLDSVTKINQEWIEYVRSRKTMLLDLQNYGVDVSKLPLAQNETENNNIKDTVALSTDLIGTFRKLNFD